MNRAALLLALAACGTRDAGPSLSDALHGPVAAMKLTRAEWTKVVVEPYRDAYDDYARAFDAAAPALEARLAASKANATPAISSRQHYAGDPDLTRGQARARWALPVQAPARVVVLDDVMLDAVFVNASGRYKAIVGVDQIVVDRTRALDDGCARYLETLGSKQCQIIGWAIADAAMRADRAKLRHACSLAVSQCAETKTGADGSW